MMIIPPEVHTRALRVGIYTDVLAYRRSGIGWHVTHLLDALSAIDSVNEYFLIHRRAREENEASFHCPATPNFHDVAVRVPDIFYSRYFRVYDRWILPRAIRKLNLDVFHGPNHYLPQRGRTPQIITYHDIAEAVTGEGGESIRQRSSAKKYLARADGLIALSECTISDLKGVSELPCDAKVIYQGSHIRQDYSSILDVMISLQSRLNITSRYALFVGSLVARKNLPLLLRAFQILIPTLEPGFRLVLAGAADNSEAQKLKVMCQNFGISDRVSFTGYLSNEELAALYRGASVFVLPSRYEGFGMILLEAMAAGVPIVSTAVGALPEVLGDAGILVPPDDPVAMAAAVGRILGSESLRIELIAKGRIRQAMFSWKTTAEQTLAMYRRVALLKK